MTYSPIYNVTLNKFSQTRLRKISLLTHYGIVLTYQILTVVNSREITFEVELMVEVS